MFGQYKFTTISFYSICLILFAIVAFFPPNNVLAYDVFGYYLYLPMEFKYSDLTLQNFSTVENIFSQYHPSETFYQALKWDNGNWVMKYPVGMAVLYAPFYFIADVLSHGTNYPSDGFSRPYQLGILYGCLFYTMIGLWFTKKVLTKYFSDRTAALTLLIVALGTNYFFHVSVHGQGAMTHNILFTLFAVIFWQTVKWHENKNRKDLFLLAALVALAALCRASEVIILIIPFLFGVTGLNSLKEKIAELLKLRKQIFISFAIIFGIGAIQFLYYKYSSGKFFINPYGAGNPGEGFELLHPHLLEVLISFRKGWLIYTPVMAFALIGFRQLYLKNKGLFFPIFIYFLINFYIVASWSHWWYSACFGIRALIPSYVLLCIPLGYFIEHIFNSKIKFLIFSVLIALTALNIFQSWQAREGILDTEFTSREYYFSTFLQTDDPGAEQKKLLLKGKSKTGLETFTLQDSLENKLSFARWKGFENKKDEASDEIKHSGKFSLLTKADLNSITTIEIPFDSISNKKSVFIRASIWVFVKDTTDLKAELKVCMRHKGWEFRPTKLQLRGKNLIPQAWNKVQVYYLTPDDLRSKKDKVCIYFSNWGGAVYIDDMLLESLEPVTERSVF
jgi:hypothetical protein